MVPAGFRSHKTIQSATTGTFDQNGAYLYAIVTNNGGTATNFYPNPNDQNGNPVAWSIDPIPVVAGGTLYLPMAIYNFKADAAVTVTAFRM